MARSTMVDLIARLRVLVGDPATAPSTYAAWQATHAYAVGDQRRPTVANGRFYRIVVAGTSAASQPTFPTNGGSVIDGTVVWQDMGAISSGAETFSDDDLQTFLDERRTVVIEAGLRYRRTLSGLYTDFFAPRGAWETGAVLTSAGSVVLTPDTADVVTGHWTFTAGAVLPVYVTGAFYDLYGSAQAVCEAWAAKVARDFDFTTDQQVFDRTGKREGLLAVAREFARKAVQPGRMPAWRSRDW